MNLLFSGLIHSVITWFNLTGNAKIVIIIKTNGHDTGFDFTPVQHTTISSRISNRKTANDDWFRMVQELL